MLPQTPDIIPTTLNQLEMRTLVLMDLGERKGLWTVNRASTLRSMLNHRQASSRRLVDAHETASAFL
ncbi:hypothetical protein HZH66_002154 [Vespula vulgaris]|uniref:Uncharacterized protein n=1 Tax=Vespula vulgaris TaxID=7454 RepID=A0A834KJD5_VESVU|nr:hypothetical protein HZH66_002154 [Vespula vulgaris]